MPGSSLPADAGSLFNSTERRAKLAERDDLLLLFFVQDIAHVDGGYSSRLSNVLNTFSLAGFQVTAEALAAAAMVSFTRTILRLKSGGQS